MQYASLGRLPAAFEIVTSLREMTEHWHQINPPLIWETAQHSFPEDLSTLKGEIQQLGLIHCFQWHLEDECRAHYSSLTILAGLKRDSDLSDQRRVHMIEVIDEDSIQALYRHRQSRSGSLRGSAAAKGLSDDQALRVRMSSLCFRT